MGKESQRNPEKKQEESRRGQILEEEASKRNSWRGVLERGSGKSSTEQESGKGHGVRVVGQESCSGGTSKATRRHPETPRKQPGDTRSTKEIPTRHSEPSREYSEGTREAEWSSK